MTATYRQRTHFLQVQFFHVSAELCIHHSDKFVKFRQVEKVLAIFVQGTIKRPPTSTEIAGVMQINYVGYITFTEKDFE